MPYSLQCRSPAWEQAGPLFFGGQALAWLSGPFRPQWPLSEQAMESLPEHALELLRVQALESLRGQAQAWLSGPIRPRWPLPKHALE